MTTIRQTGQQGLGAAWAVAVALGLGALGMNGATAAGPDDDETTSVEIEAARASQEKWVELKTQISKEKASLAEKKLFLRDRIDLVRSTIEGTRGQTEELRTSIAQTTKKREELEAENAELKAAQASLEAKVGALEAAVLALVERFPEKLREDVRAYTQQFPKDPNDTKMTLSQRYTLAVAVLQAADKFNSDIHVVSEIRDLTNGKPAQVSTLYLGLSEGFFVDGSGQFAGRGLPTDEGFQWTPINEHAEAVQRAVKVKNGDPAAYTQVPVVVETPAAKNEETK